MRTDTGETAAHPNWSMAGPTPGIGEDRTGWMMFAYSGPLQLLQLKVEQIDIRDICHGLAAINRFNGQTRVPISVLWHSLMVATLCSEKPAKTQLEALFHDAGEAYVGDFIRPLTPTLGEELKTLRARIQKTCFEAAGLPDNSAELTPDVDYADNLLVRYELESQWGYGRTISWYESPTANEQVRLKNAVERIGGPETKKANLRRSFLALARTLTPMDAPIRPSLSRSQSLS